MPTFGWVIFGILGLGALYGLAYAARALNGWLFKINEVLALLEEIRDAVNQKPKPAQSGGAAERTLPDDQPA